jgi:2-dehydro-3-deoxyphosphogluconate aldolase/(4S)-4-hydroxy-2-oxoglutarate aldolase
MFDLLSLVRARGTLPVVVIEDADHAVPLARALVAGGLDLVEITLRTPAALDAIARIAAEVPDAIVGAGTILCEADLDAAITAGARFALSPGHTSALLQAASNRPIPFVPGVATPAEVMQVRAAGYYFAKFFPATAMGGQPVLRSLISPLPDMMFCPTGGITAVNAASWRALPNVACVGGSWLAPPDLLRAQDWPAITALARAAGQAQP